MGIFYLGVDCSLRSPGVAVLCDGELVLARSVKVGDSVRGAKRLERIYDALRDLLDFYAQQPGARAAIEGPSLKSTHREFDLGEGSGVARLYLVQKTREEPLVIPPTQLKLFATSYGQASKEDVIRYVQETFRCEVDGDDEADAVVLAEIAWAFHSGVRPRTRMQAEVVRTLKNPKPPVRRTNRRERQV